MSTIPESEFQSFDLSDELFDGTVLSDDLFDLMSENSTTTDSAISSPDFEPTSTDDETPLRIELSCIGLKRTYNEVCDVDPVGVSGITAKFPLPLMPKQTTVGVPMVPWAAGLLMAAPVSHLSTMSPTQTLPSASSKVLSTTASATMLPTALPTTTLRPISSKLAAKRQKREERLAKNRAAAEKSRVQKRNMVAGLEKKAKELEHRCSDLSQENAILRTENASLKSQFLREQDLNAQLTKQMEFLQSCLSRMTPNSNTKQTSIPAPYHCETGTLPSPVVFRPSKGTTMNAGNAAGVMMMAVVFSFVFFAQPSFLDGVGMGTVTWRGSELGNNQQISRHNHGGRVLMSSAALSRSQTSFQPTTSLLGPLFHWERVSILIGIALMIAAAGMLLNSSSNLTDALPTIVTSPGNDVRSRVGCVNDKAGREICTKSSVLRSRHFFRKDISCTDSN
jgi:hypothetical protein